MGDQRWFAAFLGFIEFVVMLMLDRIYRIDWIFL